MKKSASSNRRAEASLAKSTANIYGAKLVWHKSINEFVLKGRGQPRRAGATMKTTGASPSSSSFSSSHTRSSKRSGSQPKRPSSARRSVLHTQTPTTHVHSARPTRPTSARIGRRGKVGKRNREQPGSASTALPSFSSHDPYSNHVVQDLLSFNMSNAIALKKKKLTPHPPPRSPPVKKDASKLEPQQSHLSPSSPTSHPPNLQHIDLLSPSTDLNRPFPPTTSDAYDYTHVRIREQDDLDLSINFSDSVLSSPDDESALHYIQAQARAQAQAQAISASAPHHHPFQALQHHRANNQFGGPHSDNPLPPHPPSKGYDGHLRQYHPHYHDYRQESHEEANEQFRISKVAASSSSPYFSSSPRFSQGSSGSSSSLYLRRRIRSTKQQRPVATPSGAARSSKQARSTKQSGKGRGKGMSNIKSKIKRKNQVATRRSGTRTKRSGKNRKQRNKEGGKKRRRKIKKKRHSSTLRGEKKNHHMNETVTFRSDSGSDISSSGDGDGNSDRDYSSGSDSEGGYNSYSDHHFEAGTKAANKAASQPRDSLFTAGEESRVKKEESVQIQVRAGDNTSAGLQESDPMLVLHTERYVVHCASSAYAGMCEFL